MNRFIPGLVILVGLFFVIRSFVIDVKESTPAPTKYIIRADSRVTPDGTGMTITNTSGFGWPDPVFTLNGAYRIKHSGPIKGGQALTLPFRDFKNSEGVSFPGPQHITGPIDIRTATMAFSGKS